MCGDDGTTTVGGMSSSEVHHPDRWVRLHAVHNFRDLGGYPTRDGRRTRWRSVYRADGLYRLTKKDIEIVRALGVRTVIDLRTSNEIQERGRYPVDRHDVQFHHLSVIDQTWDMADARDWTGDPAGFLRLKYHLMLAEGGERLAQALEVLSREESGVAVFHCAAGKDRTGVLAAMVLSAIGVSDHVIIADYAISGRNMDQLLVRLQEERPEALTAMNEQPSAYLAAPPEAMARLLEHVNTEYGSMTGYVRSIGVDTDAIEALASSLLE